MSTSGSDEEADLFMKINTGMPREARQRYWHLIGKREEERLAQDEHKELIQLSNISEDYQVRRLEALVKLSQLRNVPLRELMKTLGIKPTALRRVGRVRRVARASSLQERFQLEDIDWALKHKSSKD